MYGEIKKKNSRKRGNPQDSLDCCRRHSGWIEGIFKAFAKSLDISPDTGATNFNSSLVSTTFVLVLFTVVFTTTFSN